MNRVTDEGVEASIKMLSRSTDGLSVEGLSKQCVRLSEIVASNHELFVMAGFTDGLKCRLNITLPCAVDILCAYVEEGFNPLLDPRVFDYAKDFLAKQKEKDSSEH